MGAAAAERIPFRIHPRVFAALGADLVTNDVVAVIELVKNSYDAMATRVDVSYHVDADGRPFFEIRDNGLGMSRKTLETAWAVVATPYRQTHPKETRGKITRRSSGEKGLGRLSAARLGKRLEMVTKAEGNACWSIGVDWSFIAGQNALETCEASCIRVPSAKCPFEVSGTILRILGLESTWSSDQFEELRENLARLLAPFAKIEDFQIHLAVEGSQELETRVSIPEFLAKPPYSVRGHVDPNGSVKAKYEYNPIVRAKTRSTAVTLSWEDTKEGSEGKFAAKRTPECGPFDFEIRAWDISPDDTEDLSQRFKIAKGSVRKAIRAHKGISVYRDEILVLPKSEDARDWLGLDLRRVSRIGTRLSTNQIVGYVAISADRNPLLEDASNRESFMQNSAVRDFQAILMEIIARLEMERDRDRASPTEQVKLTSLLDGVTAKDLVDEVAILAEEGVASAEIVRHVGALNARLEIVQQAIKQRFVYYSRLATVGSIAQMLVHEIRNRTTSIGRFLRIYGHPMDQRAQDAFASQLSLAQGSVAALERLADTFAPLASRGFRRGKRTTTASESLERCRSLLEKELEHAKTSLSAELSADLKVAVDPGELDTLMLNLLLNAIYWVGKSQGERRIVVRGKRDSKLGRAVIFVDDTGSGVATEDEESIFLPGITKRPGGIGMGLTIAAELVSEHNGALALVQPGRMGGATFTFDLPLAS